MGGALVAISAPVYWLGLVGLYLFANDIGKFKLFPGSGSYVPFSQDPTQVVHVADHAVVRARRRVCGVLRPATALDLIETMGEDYIRTARAKGLTERRVILHHGMRSAITPIVTAAGLDIGILLGGAILTESVFNIPGIGRLAYESIQNSDLPMIQGTVLLGAFFIVFAEPHRRRAATRSIDPRRDGTRERRWRCSRSTTCACTSRREDGLVKAVDGISLLVDRGQDARHRRRVRQRASRVSSLTVMGLSRARNAPASRARRASTARTCSRPRDDGPARHPRQRHRDDLPGPAVVAAPLLQGRQADRRGDPGPPAHVEGPGAASARSSCSTWSASRTRRGASTPTRTSSRAACASAR